MRKIKHIKKTASNYLYWHKIFWNRIIKNIEIDKFLAFNISYKKMKRFTFDEMFDCKILDYCFGCEWNDGHACFGCLFDADNTQLCLNGHWKLYREAKTKEEAVEYAKLIRDFPVKEKFLK